jgi:hypothetical protein
MVLVTRSDSLTVVDVREYPVYARAALALAALAVVAVLVWIGVTYSGAR